MPRSAKVRLRAGVSRSVLPDGRSMVAGTDYVISYEDWRKISGNAKRSVVQLQKTGAHSPTGFSDAPVAVNGIDLTYNGVSLPTLGSTGRSARAGHVVDGFGDQERYILVKVGANVVKGDVLVWTNKNLYQATNVHAADSKDFAGVALGAITSGRYGWIQVTGDNGEAKVAATVVAGDVLAVDPTTDSAFRKAGQTTAPSNETQTVEIDATSGTFTLTYSGQTTAAIDFDATAQEVEDALVALSNLGAGDVDVTGTPGDYTVSFDSDLGNVAELTGDGTNLVGGASTVTIATTGGGVAEVTNATDVAVAEALTDASGGTAEVMIRGAKGRLPYQTKRGYAKAV